MITDKLLRAAQPAAPQGLTRRQFATMTIGGSVGLALLPLGALAQQAAKLPPGQNPTEQPAAFVTIGRDGLVTVLCNRMDMGQGIETALAMVCAEELGADWASVRTGFGDARPNYIDPAFGMHLTGGSNSIKNSYTQYRELGARTRAMLIAAAAEQWNVPASSLTAENGFVKGAGKSAPYGNLFDAAMKQPIPEKVALKDPKDFRIVGKPTGLKVSRAKSSGQQGYGMDVKLPGLLVAVIAHPPVFGAKPKGFDAAAAQKVAGVRAVLPVELDRGARGVAVIASGYWPAKTAREALKIDWDSSGLEKVDTAKQLAQYRELAKSGGNLAPNPNLRGDVSKLADAPHKLSAEFVFPYLNHAQMEPLACTVNLKADRCDIYTASQMPGIDAMAIAKSTGLKPEQVRIHVQMGGGGFGRRAVPSSEYLLESVAVAKALAAAGKAAPVKVIWSREDDLRAGYYRPFTVHRAEIGHDAQGNVLAWDHRIVTQSIVGGTPFEAFMVKEGVDDTAFEGMRDPYKLPMRVAVHHPKVNVPVLWWRSVGSTHTAFVMETLVDEIAEATKQDPVAYRLKLMGDGAEHARHRAALQLAVTEAGYGKKTLPAGMQWGVAVHESFESVVAYVVEAGIKDGKPVIGQVTAGVHCNFCINPRTVEAQVMGAAVMALSTTLPGAAITFKDGVVEQSNFGDYPVARMTDTPKIAVHIVPSNDPPKGMGEPGLPPFAPALANALRRAGAKPVRELPFKLA
ncbi:xanthine dehydrogenase family protein molybdopterin-binding subunit [Aquincola sp. S2]|uniref:Xanthine dehydrogenase family protein molybdopterin-binding subunit n=1 Tax=Pseudaquabacterium terrae TaxID=2732868 RepID=A0ABX2ECZ3_9BURK|nr:xanthine dehydrogenase family protein molybdopterin-binding subunit [Aquabacterium terrae]NRF65747.1 xanthine dehydrogenase family protein molybdopterin-binding subunit [Aquabacterium terrae]